MYTEPTATWSAKSGLPERVMAMMWGRPTDWTPRGLSAEGDQSKRPKLIELLGELACEQNLRGIVSPTVSEFSSRFISDGSPSPRQLSLPGTACKLHRGLHGDGFEIHPGQAGVIAPADCAVIVVTTPSSRVLMLHAGRDSLVDRTLINTGTPSKQYESIVFAALEELRRVDSNEGHKSKWLILPSISAGTHFQHRWDHERWGKSNQNLVSYLTKRYGNCVRGNINR